MKSVVRHSDPSVFQGNTYNTHSNSYCIKLHINLYVMSYSSHMPMLTTMCFSSTLQLPRVDSYRYLQSGQHIPEGGHLSTPILLHRVLKFRTVVSTSTGLAYAAISLLGCVQLVHSHLEDFPTCRSHQAIAYGKAKALFIETATEDNLYIGSFQCTQARE